MSSAPVDEFPDPPPRKAVIRQALIWPGLALLATAAVSCTRSTPLTLIMSGLALACGLLLRGWRRGAGHAFVFAQVVLVGGSAILLLTAIAISKPVFPVVAAMLEAFTRRFFSHMGQFAFFHAIVWTLVMAFVIGSQRNR
jgi:hypothetical protein